MSRKLDGGFSRKPHLSDYALDKLLRGIATHAVGCGLRGVVHWVPSGLNFADPASRVSSSPKRVHSFLRRLIHPHLGAHGGPSQGDNAPDSSGQEGEIVEVLKLPDIAPPIPPREAVERERCSRLPQRSTVPLGRRRAVAISSGWSVTSLIGAWSRPTRLPRRSKCVGAEGTSPSLAGEVCEAAFPRTELLTLAQGMLAGLSLEPATLRDYLGWLGDLWEFLADSRLLFWTPSSGSHCLCQPSLWSCLAKVTG